MTAKTDCFALSIPFPLPFVNRFAILFAIAAGLLFGAMGGPAIAANGDKIIGQSRDWTAVTFDEDGAKGCYIVSQAKKSDGDYSKRGPAYVQVTARGDQSGNVVSIQMGYPFKADAEVKVTIGSDTFMLFTQGETAWAYKDSDDTALIQAMKAGSNMVVQGTSARGTDTKDTYSLLGFAKSLAMIADACK